MKSFFLAALAILCLSCGSSNKVVKTTSVWDTLPPNEKQLYVEQMDCPTATEAFEDAIKWQAVHKEPSDTLVDEESGRYFILRESKDGIFAFFQIRPEEDGNDIVEAWILFLAENTVLQMIDYYTLRSILTNGIDNVDQAFLKATGKLFCVYNENLITNKGY